MIGKRRWRDEGSATVWLGWSRRRGGSSQRRAAGGGARTTLRPMIRLTVVAMRSLLIPMLLLVVTAAHAETATMFRGDAARSGIYTGLGVPELHGVRWKFKTGGAVLSSPAVAGDSVYFGSNDGHVYAVQAATGGLRWKQKTGGRVPSSPAVANGRVYVLSYDSHLYALDAASGTVVWKYATGGERRFSARHLHGAEPAAETMPDPFDFYLSSPAVVDGTVYFGSSDGRVHAVEAASGTSRWTFATGDVVHASPAVVDGVVYVGSWDTWLYAIDAATGAQRWRFKTGEDREIANQTGLQASPLVVDGTVYVGCRDSKFYAVDAATGRERWSYPNNGSWVIGSAVLRDGIVYFATSDTGRLNALDAATGTLVFSIENARWPMFSSPAIAGRVLYIGTHEGKLRAFDAANARAAWTFQTDGSQTNGARYTKPDGQPDYAAAYVDSFYDSIVVGLDRLLSVGAVLSSPVIAGDTLYFGSTDGTVYALH
jgi:outer membrane protein assembly factor BamB